MMTNLLSIRPSLLILTLLAGCADSDNDDATIPTVVSNTPMAGAIDVPINGKVSATFSEEMDDTSFGTNGAFTVTAGDSAINVAGTVIYADSTAAFWPEQRFATSTLYTAMITTDAVSALGVPLAAEHSWSFTIGNVIGPELSVPLGTAEEFVILAKSGISSVPASVITGDIGLSPAAATYVTGFSLSADASNEFATSPQVSGNVYASDYAPPTPSRLTTAVADMEIAFTAAAGRAPDVRELGAGDIGGMDLAPGVYKWGTGLLIPTDVMLTGSATDVWIFEIAGDLMVSSGVRVSLAGGARSENVFWQVAGAVELGTTSHFEGIVLTKTSVTMRTGATINGRLFAQTAVEMDASTVTEPSSFN